MENKDAASWSSAPIYQSQWLQTTISGFSLPLSLTTHALLGVTYISAACSMLHFFNMLMAFFDLTL